MEKPGGQPRGIPGEPQGGELLDRGITDFTVIANYTPKGSKKSEAKDVWRLLDDAGKANYPDKPWPVLLTYYGCTRTHPQRLCPCPCVWRRPPTGPMSHGEPDGLRWDWRSCKAERSVRLALQHRVQVRERP